MVQNNIRILKGQIVYAKSMEELIIHKNSYLVSKNGIVEGIYEELPQELSLLPKEDYGDRLIIPGLVDLHVHAPQYAFRGTGMDLELIDWLNTYTFPEESKYFDEAYAERAYSLFVNELKIGATTRAAVFATVHNNTTLMLMDMLAAAGIGAYVGKVNMDRNCPKELCETAQDSLNATKEFIAMCKKHKRVKPILTPRFIPSCSDELMRGLAEIQKQEGLPVQSHLSENKGEVAWVKQLCPWASCYADAYNEFGLFGGEVPTIMAHCVYPDTNEAQLIAQNKVFVAHCPQSNTNLASGIAPIRKYIDMGAKIGLGTDVAGGASLSMLRAMADAISVSKLYMRLVNEEAKPLSLCEAFYMATKGGGEFFGKVGSFEKGYCMDAVVLGEELYPHPQPLTIQNRLERTIYLADDRAVLAKYIDGEKIK